MRRFLPPRSGVRRASPAPSLGCKKQPRIVLPVGSRLGPGRLQRTARRVARQHRGARQRHPCPCGERVADSMVTLLAYGSPPPMRGMPARTAFFCSSIGSPPHTRGKSALPPDGNLSLRSTPHMRGTVLFCVIPVGMPPHGSPPRLRGKAERDDVSAASDGITPACAGKRPIATMSTMLHRNHPRVCWEKAFSISCNLSMSGSPPPVRGKAGSHNLMS